MCLDGADITGNLMDYRRHIGFLTSELKLEDYFTPNYLFDYFSKLYGVGEEQAAQRKKELFEKFGIDKFAEVKVADMSTGMKQKISLVISIVPVSYTHLDVYKRQHLAAGYEPRRDTA